MVESKNNNNNNKGLLKNSSLCLARIVRIGIKMCPHQAHNVESTMIQRNDDDFTRI